MSCAPSDAWPPKGMNTNPNCANRLIEACLVTASLPYSTIQLPTTKMKGGELLLFALDVDQESGLEATKGITRLEVMKQSILISCHAKRRVDTRHMFGVLLLTDDAELVAGPTRSVEAISSALNRVHASPAHYPAFDLGCLIGTSRKVLESVKADVGQGSLQVHVVLLYCRSNTLPTWRINRHLSLAVDVMYMHERPTPGVNCPQEVFTCLEEQCDSMAKAAGHLAYIFECSAGNIKKWLNVMVWMLAAPSQRPPQSRLQLLPPDMSTLPAPLGITENPYATSTSQYTSPPASSNRHNSPPISANHHNTSNTSSIQYNIPTSVTSQYPMPAPGPQPPIITTTTFLGPGMAPGLGAQPPAVGMTGPLSTHDARPGTPNLQQRTASPAPATPYNLNM